MGEFIGQMPDTRLTNFAESLVRAYREQGKFEVTLQEKSRLEELAELLRSVYGCTVTWSASGSMISVVLPESTEPE